MHDFGPSEFRNNVLALVRAAAYFKVPSIITTSFDTGPNGPVAKEITDQLPNAAFIRRPGQINAMDNEDFANAVKATGKKQVVIRYSVSTQHFSQHTANHPQRRSNRSLRRIPGVESHRARLRGLRCHRRIRVVRGAYPRSVA